MSADLGLGRGGCRRAGSRACRRAGGMITGAQSARHGRAGGAGVQQQEGAGDLGAEQGAGA
ncbi:hypothetical protein SLEP1_g12483 [Rubroshorea leprosula]|uniref:Uncharacterized protein n=1 Tax=Rubroshorea leprosula TaxID=152421 RepID=A0AAV5IIE5_9ROSI|nr:hypothetical protein SLEP1_g12483 [Rubroshorea leprosula]